MSFMLIKFETRFKQSCRATESNEHWQVSVADKMKRSVADNSPCKILSTEEPFIPTHIIQGVSKILSSNTLRIWSNVETETIL